ncbi:hypothetical protein ABZ738_05640 [Micromonospora sp. NPDC047793]|uniref:hypothetical protein n=1 Tax=Micromonospora sp. NPDC047793 TaxID=3154342 RepID=UPI0033D5EED9
MPQTIDLSHKGVDRILAALAAEGIEVHYSETDGDTAIDVWLTDVELADGMPATVLSWRDTEGWLLRHWDEFGGDTNTQAPDRKWPIAAGSPAEVARDVAACLTADEPTECYCANNSEQCPNCNPHESDYWLTLADDLRAVADKLATLAGTPAPQIGPTLHIAVGLWALAGHEVHVPVVDAIADTFGVSAEDRKSGGSWERVATAKVGVVRVHPYAQIPAPEDAEKAALLARIAELEAQAAGGVA